MRVKCECGEKAKITNRTEYSSQIAKLYCVCQNPNCAHSFVMNLSFSHSIRPAANSLDQMIFDRLKAMKPHQQQALMSRVQENHT